jgi:hypothetical protein
MEVSMPLIFGEEKGASTTKSQFYLIGSETDIRFSDNRSKRK